MGKSIVQSFQQSIDSRWLITSRMKASIKLKFFVHKVFVRQAKFTI
jgi:hypothetical protein